METLKWIFWNYFKKCMESNLASVITTRKLAPNSLVSSINQYLRNPLKVRLYQAILLLFYMMEVQILLLLRKKAFISWSQIQICSSQHWHFFVWKTYQIKMLMTMSRLLKVVLVYITWTIICEKQLMKPVFSKVE